MVDRRFNACSACLRQYDVTDHLPGRKVRCECGEVFAVVHHRPHSPRPVKCSGCGAPLDAGATACRFCRVEVTFDERRLGSICPQCYARMPSDGRFCPECGIGIAPQRVLPIPEGTSCPRCRSDLVSRAIGPTSVIECSACLGLWIARATFDQVVADAEARQRVEGSLGPDGSARERRIPDEVRYLECVVCGELMNRRNFALASGVIVDICRSHGVWFDAGELRRVLDFVRDGGLARAREREEREKRDRERRRRSHDSTMERITPPLARAPAGTATSFWAMLGLGLAELLSGARDLWDD